MAGTRKTAAGRSDSTSSNQRPASNFGRNNPRMPSFIGLYTDAIPAKVDSGEPCIQPAPVQWGKPLGIIAALSWRTTTPLARPVVPDVYIRSAMSWSSTAT